MMKMKAITKNMKRMKTSVDRRSERILTFKNKFNGEFVYSSTLYQPKLIDGTEFIMVFPKPAAPKERRTNWMKRDNLELIQGI